MRLSDNLYTQARNEILEQLKDKDYSIKDKKLFDPADDILMGKLAVIKKMDERHQKMANTAVITGFIGVLTKAHRKDMRSALTTFPGVTKDTAKVIIAELFPVDDEE